MAGIANTTGFAITATTPKLPTPAAMNFSEQRIFMGISYLILCIIGSFGNILLAIIFYQTWSRLGKIPFYFIASQLLFVDFCIHLSQIAVAIPTTLWFGSREQLRSYHENPIIQIISMLDTVGFFAGLYFSFLICINRFFVLYLHWGFKAFEKPRIYFVIGISWAFLIAIILASNAFGCTKSFSQTKYFFFYACGTNEIGKAIINGVKYASYVIPAIMCLMYLRTFIGFDERFTMK
uniref:G-protein coupled receptors family 1 profile domain-containing protein n=1 Tax=Panagrolaimus sp. PS1159 TaxID=55785 RepID=A0AC35FS76_9BILA